MEYARQYKTIAQAIVDKETKIIPEDQNLKLKEKEKLDKWFRLQEIS